MSEKAMSLDDLRTHIEKTTLPLIEQTIGEKVKDVVSSSLETALKPIKGDLTKAETEREDLVQKLKAASNDKSTFGKVERQKGQAFGRIVCSLLKAGNNPDRAISFLRKSGDGDLADLMEEHAKIVDGGDSKSMTAGDPETGGILIPQPVSQEIIELLRARVVVRRMGAMELPIPFGNYRMPKITQGSTAYYVGEATAATVSKVKTGHVMLSFKKLVTAVPVSNDLFRYSSPGADLIIRNDITRNMAVREDRAFLRDVGTDATPKGLLQWALDNTGQTITANGTVNLDNVTTDLGKLMLKLIEADVPLTRAGWLMAPRTWNYLMLVRTTNGPYAFRDEMSRGTLMGFPFAFTTQIPITYTVPASGSNQSDLYFVDFDDVVIGDSQQLIIDASGDAAYEEGGTVKSAFHRDETSIQNRPIDSSTRGTIKACIAIPCKMVRLTLKKLWSYS